MAEDLATWLHLDPYTRDLGVKLEVADGTSSRLKLPWADRNTTNGHLHGGAIASLASIASFTIGRAGGRLEAGAPCTVALHVGYVRAARKSVTIESRLVRRARELGFFETHLTDEDGQVVAYASSSVREDSSDVTGFSVDDPDLREPQAPRAPEVDPAHVSAFHEAIAASPFLSRRHVRIHSVHRGLVELSQDAAAENLDRHGALHEGAVLTLIDAAGATSPWTLGLPSGGWGATIAIDVQITGPLPPGAVIARASLRARDSRMCWSDVTVRSAATQQVHAFGTVVYRFAG